MLRDRILDVVADRPQGITLRALRDIVGAPKREFNLTIRALHRSGEIERCGRGVIKLAEYDQPEPQTKFRPVVAPAFPIPLSRLMAGR